jgi:hypothetical protein
MVIKVYYRSTRPVISGAVSFRLDRENLLNSPFLIEVKGRIVGGIFFFIASLISAFNPNLNDLFSKIPWLPYSFVFASLPVIFIAMFETSKLGNKIDVVGLYYRLSFLYQSNLDHIAAVRDIEGYKRVRGDHRYTIELLRFSIERGDWVEANTIKKLLINLLGMHKILLILGCF